MNAMAKTKVMEIFAKAAKEKVPHEALKEASNKLVLNALSSRREGREDAYCAYMKLARYVNRAAVLAQMAL